MSLQPNCTKPIQNQTPTLRFKVSIPVESSCFKETKSPSTRSENKTMYIYQDVIPVKPTDKFKARKGNMEQRRGAESKTWTTRSSGDTPTFFLGRPLPFFLMIVSGPLEESTEPSLLESRFDFLTYFLFCFTCGSNSVLCCTRGAAVDEPLCDADDSPSCTEISEEVLDSAPVALASSLRGRRPRLETSFPFNISTALSIDKSSTLIPCGRQPIANHFFIQTQTAIKKTS